MLATAGEPAVWFWVTQSTPAMTLGDAVRRAADGAGDVRAVAVAVGGAAAVVDRGVARDRTTAELRVRVEHAGVDDVRRHARAGGVVGVGVVERQVALVDAVQAPRGGGLGRVELHRPVGLDVGDVGVLAQRGQGLVVERGGEPVQHGRVGVADAGALRLHLRLGGAQAPAGRVLVEHDDVAVVGGGAEDRREAVVGERGLRGLLGLLRAGRMGGGRGDGECGTGERGDQACRQSGACMVHRWILPETDGRGRP
jgi:hypothetical protein